MRFLVESPWGAGPDEEFRFEWDGSLYESGLHRRPVPCDLPEDATEQSILELLAAWYPRATSISIE